MHRLDLYRAGGLAVGIVALLSSAASAAPAGDALVGKTAFNQQCRVCHQVAQGAGSATGPNLAGVTGKAAGFDAAFDYSPALRAAGSKGLKWTAATLDGFLAKPQAQVPGSRMPISVANPKTRQDLIAYLATLTP